MLLLNVICLDLVNCAAPFTMIKIALLYYTVIIVINRTDNSNCFDVPCIPSSHLVSWHFHLCEIKLRCYYNCFAIVKKVHYIFVC